MSAAMPQGRSDIGFADNSACRLPKLWPGILSSGRHATLSFIFNSVPLQQTPGMIGLAEPELRPYRRGDHFFFQCNAVSQKPNVFLVFQQQSR